MSINASGQVTGYVNTPTQTHAVLWNSGGIQDLGTLGGISSWPIAMNDIGQVIGFDNSNQSFIRSFLASPGMMMTDLGNLGGSSTPTAINNRGQVVGASYFGHVVALHPFIWENNLITDLGPTDVTAAALDINDTGDVVGSGDIGNGGSQALLWHEQQQIVLPGLILFPGGGHGVSEANAINGAGAIVGAYDNHATAWVQDTAPVADASATKTQVVSPNGVSVPLTLDGTRSTDADGDSLTYTWYLNRSTNRSAPPIATGKTPTETLGVGNYTFDLDVKDAWLLSSTSVNVTVFRDTPPVADASATKTQVISPNGVNATFTLDGSRSTDADGDPLSYAWYLNKAANPSVPPYATGVNPTVRLAVGSYSIELDVNDPWLQSSNTINVSVITITDAINNLAGQVMAAGLPNGITKTLQDDLNAALSSLSRGNPKTAVNHLQQFIKDVNSQLGNKIDNATGILLINADQAIINAVNGA